MARYVPKTYNNRRVLRIIVGAVTTIALSIVILFLILFFLFSNYVVDGQLEIPWLTENEEPAPPLNGDGADGEYGDNGEGDGDGVGDVDGDPSG
jgi:hypothetical protein